MGILSDPDLAGEEDYELPPQYPYPPYPSSPRRGSGEEDEGTLYRDDESFTSDDVSIFSDDSSVFDGPPARTWKNGLRGFQIGKADPQKQVFECWKMFLVPERQKLVCGTKLLGINLKDWDHRKEFVNLMGVVKNQSELVETYRNAVDRHESRNKKRSWPARVFGDGHKSYEQDLEERCTKLPLPIQNEIRDLLADRGMATSSIHRQRTWTVVHVEERYVHRFTRAQGAKVNRHKLRFWKNPRPKEQLTEYHVIIRGAETGTAEDSAGYPNPDLNHNPWWNFDMRDQARVLREEHERRRNENAARRRRRARARSVSAVPRDRSRFRPETTTFRGGRRPPSPVRVRSRSRDSWASSNYHWRRHGDDFDEFDVPESLGPRSRPRVFDPIPPPSNRPFPRRFPPAPTPPESFTPPPGIADFRSTKPRVFIPPPPPPPPPARDWRMTPPSPSTEFNPFAPAPSRSSLNSNPFLSAGPCPPYSSQTAWLFDVPPRPAPVPPLPAPPTELPSWTRFEFDCRPLMPLPPHPPPPRPQHPAALPKLKSLCQACKATPDCPHFPGIHCFRLVRYPAYPDTGETHFECMACLSNNNNKSLPKPPGISYGAAVPMRPYTGGFPVQPPPPPPPPPVWVCPPPPPPPPPRFLDDEEEEEEDEDNTTVMDEDDDDDESVAGSEQEEDEDDEEEEDVSKEDEDEDTAVESAGERVDDDEHKVSLS